MVVFSFSFKIFEVLSKVGIIICVRSECHSIAILYNSFTSDKDLQYWVKSVVYSQLMAIQLKGTVGAIVNKYSWFGRSTINDTVFKLFQEQNLSLLLKIYCTVFALYDLVRSIRYVRLGNRYWLVLDLSKTRNRQRLIMLRLFLSFKRYC